MASVSQQIDATVDVVTPENIAFSYRVVGPFRRLPAFLVDLAVRGVIWTALVFAVRFFVNFDFTGTLVGLGEMVLLFAWFVIEWFYGGLFETFMNGQTPGKWLLGIRVVTIEGQPINGMQAILRNVIRAVDLMPAIVVIPTALLGLTVMMLNRRFQRIGDLATGTMVVLEERTWLLGVAKLEDPRAAQLAAYLPPKFEVSRSLSKALAAYVERRMYFSAARRREIARHLAEPLLHEFGLPSDTSHDLLLCALYYKAFIAEHGDESGPSPFSTVPQPQPFQQPAYSPPPLAQEQMVTTGLSGTGVSGTGVSGTGVSGTGVSGTGVSGTGVSGTGLSGTGLSGTGTRDNPFIIDR